MHSQGRRQAAKPWGGGRHRMQRGGAAPTLPWKFRFLPLCFFPMAQNAHAAGTYGSFPELQDAFHLQFNVFAYS